MSDTIAQVLTSIVNAQAARKPAVKVIYSKMNHSLLKVLAQHGFVGAIERAGKKEKKYLEVTLKYSEENKAGVIQSLRRVSKPGRRIYQGYHQLRWPQGVLMIISTPQGVMSALEAKKKKLGGEIICSVF
jgi:small subunit ribosomal protein S8